MGLHVALLRGVNVGGKNKLPMKSLVAIFEALGAENVRTYIQSGNVVFGASKRDASGLPAKVESAIASEFGHDVPVVLRSADELREILRANPFLPEGAETKTLHVGFLDKTPTRTRADVLDPERSPPDRFALRGRELYLHCPNGMARTKLTNRYFDTTLAATTTMRNWKTVSKLTEMAGVGD